MVRAQSVAQHRTLGHVSSNGLALLAVPARCQGTFTQSSRRPAHFSRFAQAGTTTIDSLMMGLLGLALLGVALALALGFAISIWWLRPQRTFGARGAQPI